MKLFLGGNPACGVAFVPTRGRGLKLREAITWIRNQKFVPTRGRGLKPVGNVRVPAPLPFVPTRGRGL